MRANCSLSSATFQPFSSFRKKYSPFENWSLPRYTCASFSFSWFQTTIATVVSFFRCADSYLGVCAEYYPYRLFCRLLLGFSVVRYKNAVKHTAPETTIVQNNDRGFFVLALEKAASVGALLLEWLTYSTGELSICERTSWKYSDWYIQPPQVTTVPGRIASAAKPSSWS